MTDNILDLLTKKLLRKGVPKARITEPLNMVSKRIAEDLIKDVLLTLQQTYGSADIKQYKTTNNMVRVVFRIPDVFRVEEAKNIRDIFRKHFLKNGLSDKIVPIISSGNIIGYNSFLTKSKKISFIFKPIDRINKGFLTEGLLTAAIYLRIRENKDISEENLINFLSIFKETQEEIKFEEKIEKSKLELFIRIPQESIDYLVSPNIKNIMGFLVDSVINFANQNYNDISILFHENPQTLKVLNIGTKGSKADIIIETSDEKTKRYLGNSQKLSIKANSGQIGQKRVGQNYKNFQIFLENIFKFPIDFEERSFQNSNGDEKYLQELLWNLFLKIGIDFDKRKNDKKYIYKFLESIEEQVMSSEDNLSYVYFSPRTTGYNHWDFNKFAETFYDKLTLSFDIKTKAKWPIIYISYVLPNGDKEYLVSIRPRYDAGQKGFRIYLEKQKGLNDLFRKKREV